MKILMVEDDEQFSHVIKVLLEQQLKAEVKIVEKGHKVAFIAETFRPQVILLDLFIGKENGLHVLSKIRREYYTRRIPVIVLSANNDPKIIKSAIQLGANDYIVKPPNTNVLLERILRICSENKIRKPSVIKKIDQLPSPDDTEKCLMMAKKLLFQSLSHEELQVPVLPKIALEVQKHLKDSKTGLKEIADVIKKDVAIASKILKIANSSYYCAVKKISDIHHAVTRIGIKEIKYVVQMISGKQLFTVSRKEMNEAMQKLWEHSLTCAYLNQLIAEKKQIKEDQSEFFFLMGLTHDIGKVFLFYLISKIMDSNSEISKIFTKEVLNQLIFQLHAQLGEVMLKKWNYPIEFIETARDHHKSFQGIKDSPLHVKVTYFSDLFSRKLGFSVETEWDEDAVIQAASLLDLFADDVPQIEKELDIIMEKVKASFFTL